MCYHFQELLSIKCLLLFYQAQTVTCDENGLIFGARMKMSVEAFCFFLGGMEAEGVCILQNGKK